MNEIVAHLQRRVEENKKALDVITVQIQKANAERETLKADLEGFERALEAEMRIQGITRIASLNPMPVPSEPASNSNGVHEINKAEFARKFIRDHPNGLLPREILKGFKDAGIPIGTPYVYALVQRLQKQGQIRQRRDKWFPVTEPAKEEDDTSTDLKGTIWDDN